MTESQRIVIDAICQWGSEVEEIDRFGTTEQRQIFSDWWGGKARIFGDNLVFNEALSAIEMLGTGVSVPGLRSELQCAIVDYFQDSETIDYVRMKFGIGLDLNFSAKGLRVYPIQNQG